jgi:hypothetical protein
MFIDSHNPFPGQNDNNTWFYSRQSSGIRSENLDLYRRLLKDNGGYVFNREPLYATDGQTSATWVDSVISGIDFSTSMETSWIGRTDNMLWTIPLYLNHGEVLGRGMSDYISNIVTERDIILDNSDTLNGVTITGQWTSSTFVPGFWGANYIHDGNTQQGSKNVKYSPQIDRQGYYEIFIRYTGDPGRATNVPVRIIYSGNIKDTIINQENRGSQWLSLGLYQLEQGNTSSVTVSNTGANEFVIADAVKFSPRNNCNPIGVISGTIPREFYLSVFPNPFNPSVNFRFSLTVRSHVNISVYDLTGKSVCLIVDDDLSGGEHNFAFRPIGLSSGVFFYKAVIDRSDGNSMVISGKLVFVK